MNLDNTDSDNQVVGDDKWRKNDDGVKQFCVLNSLCSVDHKKMCEPDDNDPYNNRQVNIKELHNNKKI